MATTRRLLLSLRQVRTCSVAIVCVWIVVLWQQLQTVQRQQQEQQASSSSVNGSSSSSSSRNASHTSTTQPQRDTLLHSEQSGTVAADAADARGDAITATAAAAGYLNGIPVVYHNSPPPASKIDCTHYYPFRQKQQQQSQQQQQQWMWQSCRFENLCWDLQQHDFVLIHQPSDQNENDSYAAPCWNQNNDASNNSNNNTYNCAVALGGINPRYDQGEPGPTKGSWKLQWFPRIVSATASMPTTTTTTTGYYQLPSHVVWSPFHSMAGHNVGHLLWDDFYPLFRLWRRYGVLPFTKSSKASKEQQQQQQQQQKQTQILLWRQKLVKQQALYATCDIRRNKRMQCKRNFQKFVSLVGVDPSTFSTSKDYQWNVTTTITTKASTTSLICARTGIAGIGLLTDHGLSDHGWDDALTDHNNNKKMNDPPHNLGHGRDLYAFRDFVLKNAVGRAQVEAWQAAYSNHASSSSRKRRIVFSLESSKDWDRRLNFTQHQAALQAANITTSSGSAINIEAHRLWQLSLHDQLHLAVTTDIFVTVCGGGSMTATFLPRGATLIVFYNPVGGYDFANGVRNHHPARLDWDLLNNAASHLRVHWLPITKSMLDGTIQTIDPEVELFVELIRHELDMLDAL